MSQEAVREPYVDYDYYSNEYMGNLDLTRFSRNLKWATALIDEITYGRIAKLDSIPDCVKDAVCSAVEKYDQYKQLKDQKLKSESNDGYAVSYADAEKMSAVRLEIIADMKMYLAGTGLIYRGRSRKYDNKPGHHGF